MHFKKWSGFLAHPVYTTPLRGWSINKWSQPIFCLLSYNVICIMQEIIESLKLRKACRSWWQCKRTYYWDHIYCSAFMFDVCCHVKALRVPYRSMWAQRERQNSRSVLKPISVTTALSSKKPLRSSLCSRSIVFRHARSPLRSAPAHPTFGWLRSVSRSAHVLLS